MGNPSAQGASEGEHLNLLAGSLAHVFDYLNTGSSRAALRAQLLLDRLDASATPGSHAAAGSAALRQAIAEGRPMPSQECLR